MITQLRLDKWLWYCRFYKSRSTASHEIKIGKFRVNGIKIEKCSTLLRPGDIIIFSGLSQLRAIKVLKLGNQRLPYSEAQKYYADVPPEQFGI